jgi:hypothetical protein
LLTADGRPLTPDARLCSALYTGGESWAGVDLARSSDQWGDLVLEESLPMKHIRSFIRTSVLVLCACFVSLGCGSVAWGQQAEGKRRVNCSEFHRPDMMRYNLHEHVLNVNNVGELQVKWSCNTGSAVDASPAVLNGVVYVGSADDPCTR